MRRPRASVTSVAPCRARALALSLLAVLATVPHAHAEHRRSTPTRSLVTYATRGPLHLRMDVSIPRDSQRAPAVVLLHGGGWWSGSRQDMADTAQQLVDLGYVVASVDYRLTCGTQTHARRMLGFGFNRIDPLCADGDRHVEDQVADVRDAVTWVRRHASAIHVDPSRIALAGSSAGGHLALLAAIDPPMSARVAAVVNWSGATSTRFVDRQAAHSFGSIKAPLANAIGCTLIDCPELWDDASPQGRASRRTPHVAVFSSVSQRERQVTPGALAAFHRVVRRFGWTDELVVATGSCHSRGCLTVPVVGRGGGTVFTRTTAFLARVLR